MPIRYLCDPGAYVLLNSEERIKQRCGLPCCRRSIFLWASASVWPVSVRALDEISIILRGAVLRHWRRQCYLHRRHPSGGWDCRHDMATFHWSKGWVGATTWAADIWGKFESSSGQLLSHGLPHFSCVCKFLYWNRKVFGVVLDRRKLNVHDEMEKPTSQKIWKMYTHSITFESSESKNRLVFIFFLVCNQKIQETSGYTTFVSFFGWWKSLCFVFS